MPQGDLTSLSCKQRSRSGYFCSHYDLSAVDDGQALIHPSGMCGFATVFRALRIALFYPLLECAFQIRPSPVETVAIGLADCSQRFTFAFAQEKTLPKVYKPSSKNTFDLSDVPKLAIVVDAGMLLIPGAQRSAVPTLKLLGK